MIKAIFVDFYGTLVHEDGEVVEKISQIIYETGHAVDTAEIGSYWWKDFQQAFLESCGENFETQRALEEKSLRDTIEHFGSTADWKALSEEMFAHWVKPPIFDDTKAFFEECTLPIYIVSNIDRADVLRAIEYHGLSPAGVFTSEDARAYKPRKELFELALRETKLHADEVIHIGDSMSSDVKGAGSLGISAIWLNRSGREVPEGVMSMEALQFPINIPGRLEFWDLYDREGNRTGEVFERYSGRGEKLPEGRYHMVCDILVRHVDGTYLLTKRHPQKDAYPGFWEASAGGSAVMGEDPLVCAKRELFEETGIVADSYELISHTFRDASHCMFYSYLVVVDCEKDAVKLQEGETVDYKWVDRGGLLEYVDSDLAIKTHNARYQTYFDKVRHT